VDTPEVETAETHKAVAGGSRKELVQKFLQMKTEREAYAAANELFVDVMKSEKLVEVAVDVADAEGKQQEGGEQVVAVSPTVPCQVVL
jgi:hypothetical protein